MNHISASVEAAYDHGDRYMVTVYTGECGCKWRVDMWGNVRSVAVCKRCLNVPTAYEQQLAMFSPAAESE